MTFSLNFTSPNSSHYFDSLPLLHEPLIPRVSLSPISPLSLSFTLLYNIHITNGKLGRDFHGNASKLSSRILIVFCYLFLTTLSGAIFMNAARISWKLDDFFFSVSNIPSSYSSSSPSYSCVSFMMLLLYPFFIPTAHFLKI